jgi:phosphate transport system permease protein
MIKPKIPWNARGAPQQFPNQPNVDGAAIAIALIALMVVGCFALLVGDLFWHGTSQLSWTFLTAAPQDAGRGGGIGPIIVSTAWIMAICLGVSCPLGLGTAFLLAEFRRQVPGLNHWVELSLDILAGVPSIVFGLFGNAFFAKTLGLGFSILSGGLTLACMVLPIFIRAVQQGLMAVPIEYRRSSLALGISHGAMLRTLVLPAAMPAVVVGLLLGFGRAIAETAALIFTSGYVDRLPSSVMNSGRSLSVHIFDLAMNVPGGEPQAYGTACVLILGIGVTNLMISGLGHWFQISRIQR